ncbi:MAG: hypothetical protein LBM69_10590 [Lachnospiraceae bacterium]|nr:hypothetical protein [Lachnospiraceae bacterium]
MMFDIDLSMHRTVQSGGVWGAFRSVEMRPSENERLLVRSFLLPGLIGTLRETSTPNSPTLYGSSGIHRP